MSMCINPSIPCMSPIAKNTPYFFILPLIFTIAKNYSLVLNFTPYFHAQGVNYSFGKTLVRALHLVTHNNHNSSNGNCQCSVISATLDFPEMPFAAKSYEAHFLESWTSRHPGHDKLPSETMFRVGHPHGQQAF